ncbi:MAG: sensor domain-containing protein [Bacillota bacterium]
MNTMGSVILAMGSAAILVLAWLLHLTRLKLERLEAERKALRERDRHMVAILENVANALLLVGPDGRIQEVSAGAVRLLGRPAPELRGNSCRTLVHPSDFDAYDDLLRSLITAQGAEVRRELRLVQANGSLRWMEVVATNLLEDPNVEGFLIQAYDVTEYKRVQEALQEREARLWATMNQVPAILWVVDKELRIIHAMGAGLRAPGLTADKGAAASLSDFVGPERVVIQRALAGKSGEVEVRVRARLLRTFVEPFRGQGGEVVGVLGITFDTTELNKTQTALIEEGRLHRLLSDHAGDLIASVDPNGNVTYVSPACEPLLGFSQEEFRRLANQLVHPEDAARLTETMQQALAGEQVRTAYRIRRKDGSYVWFETLARPVRDQEGRPSGLVTSSRDVTEQKRIEEQLLHMAYHDQMTGLPNKAAFEKRLTQALTGHRRQHVVVIQLDVDNFKVINDSLGHQAGDDALMEIGERLRHYQTGGMVARLSGDEFCVLLEGISDADGAIDATERLAAALDSPLHIGGREFQVTFSFGIAMGASRVSTPKELLREADVALHYAKRQGKARYVLYHPSMTANALERLELDADLRRAVREGQLTLFYQPIVALKSRTVVGAEALIRWRHPRRGWVSPGEFIPIAEQSGYIITLGRWVLEQACREAKSWHQRFRKDEPLSVSVNLSAVQVQDPALVDEVAEVLEATGLAPENLTLEITETALMKNPEFTRPILQRLKSLGIKLAMDDFGAGHSSLHYLKQFPIDVLKIDRSFVSGLGLNRVDSALVRTVITLAGVLNMGVTAEGVESPEQVAELMGIGCDKAQGYYYALPVPSEELGPVLAGLSLRAVKGI